ncbi:MAG: acetolactate decarboxylase, partial [Verrucomicrobiota bacterium]
MSQTITRPTLLAYNTVERVLRGDFFHTVDRDTLVTDLSSFPKSWDVNGIGTTNWYRRNGETMISGNAGEPGIMWSDPEGDQPMEVIDLFHEAPSDSGGDLISPSIHDQEGDVTFPFLAVAVGDPDSVAIFEKKSCDDVHAWLWRLFNNENIGLAGLELSGTFTNVEYSTAFYLPLEGIDLSAGYKANGSLKTATRENGIWKMGGVFAANVTLQRMLSVEGLPAHLHGYETSTRVGGHIIRMEAENIKVKIWPLKDLIMKIRNLDY